MLKLVNDGIADLHYSFPMSTASLLLGQDNRWKMHYRSFQVLHWISCFASAYRRRPHGSPCRYASSSNKHRPRKLICSQSRLTILRSRWPNEWRSQSCSCLASCKKPGVIQVAIPNVSRICVAAIMMIVVSTQYNSYAEDIMFNGAPPTYWSAVEIHLSVIACE